MSPTAGSADSLTRNPALPRADHGTAVAPLRSRTESTMDAVKALILRENLQPGDSLPTEAALCETLGVSRSSVREAIRKLEALHIVTVEHGRGTFVGSLSLDPLVETLAFRATLQNGDHYEGLRDVIEVRRYLDLGCADNVVATMRGTAQPQLQALVDTMVKRARRGKFFEEQDIQFHLGLLSLSPNTVIKQLVHSLWLVHMAVVPWLGLEIVHRLTDSAAAHQRMLDAALAGDVQAYRDAVIKHYEPIEEILYSHM